MSDFLELLNHARTIRRRDKAAGRVESLMSCVIRADKDCREDREQERWHEEQAEMRRGFDPQREWGTLSNSMLGVGR